MTPDELPSAGRRGDTIRSDLWVGFELRDTGGVRIRLRSKVAAYFGEAIERQVRDLLGQLAVTNALVEIEDSGALPFVIAARVEAAALRAGVQPAADSRPVRAIPLPPPSAPDRMRRSRLYLPGNEPKYFPNAGLYRPDAVILDLEDSVHPEQKDAARILVRNALRGVDFRGAERMVRINPLPLGLQDLEVIVPEHPEMILLPKVESAEQVQRVAATIDDRMRGIDSARPLWLMPILETARGIENSLAIASASPRVAALTIGLEDYAADLGVPRSATGSESHYARTRLVNAARAAEVQPIDSVFGQVDDLDGLRGWALDSRQLGFEGMGCLHPRQIPVIHDAFSPTEEELARARSILVAFDEAQRQGLGVVSLGSKMIDPPVVEQARRTVARAAAQGRGTPQTEMAE